MKTSGRKEKKPSFAALDSDRMATTITAREFETQFKSLYRPLCLFALRYTERTDEAEDIVQQAFADVWGRRISCSKPSPMCGREDSY